MKKFIYLFIIIGVVSACSDDENVIVEDLVGQGETAIEEIKEENDNMTGAETETEAIIFTGPMIEVRKAPNTDFRLAENQDLITDNIIITRGNTLGLFNIAKEESFATGQGDSTSPEGTEWAVGSTNDDPTTLDFNTWSITVQNPSQAVANRTNYVLHIMTENVFVDIVFTGWTLDSEGGGGFAYERSTQE